MSHSDGTQSGSAKPTRVAQLQQVKRALARASFTLCWLPSVSLALFYWVQGNGHPPVLLFVLLSLWYLVDYKVPRKYSDFLSILLAMLLLYAPVWEPSPSARFWYAITLAGVSTVVLSALYVPWPLALGFIFTSALIEHFVIVSQPNFLFSLETSVLDEWIAPLWLLLLGSFIGFALHRLEATFSHEDRIAESMEALKARDAIARALSEEHTSQRRRLHETVLNTLASLVRKDTGSTAPLLTRLRNEIAEARVYQGLEAPTSMSAIVGSVIPATNASDPLIEITEGDDILLSQTVARDVRDAIAELIRNAVKHSGGRHILISWGVGDTNLLVRVADDGVGLSEKASKGLGLGRILPEILRDRHAKMSITTNGGVGTQVVLSIPLITDGEMPTVKRVPYSILEEFDSVGRILLAAPALSVAALGWWLVGPFEPKPLLIGLLIVHVASVLTASINPRARDAWVLIAVGLLVGLVIIFLMSISSKICTNIGQLRWAANFLYDTTSVALVFYAPGRLRPLLIVATTGGLFVMSLFLPSACASALITPAIVLFGLFVVILALWRQSNRWRDNVRLGMGRNVEMTRRRIERRLGAYRADQWFSALDYLDRFATAAATGSLINGALQRQAHIEEERLRARIQLDPFVNGAFAQLALDLVDVAATRGWTPTITVVETFTNSPPIPESVKRALSQVFSGVENGRCHITLYIDENEECMTIVSSSLELQRAATEIRTSETYAESSSGANPIRVIFESVNSERWLEMSRRL